VAAALSVTMVATGCGVPIDGQDRALRGNIPGDLLVPLPTTTTTSPPVSPTTGAPVTSAIGVAPPLVDYPLDLYFADGTKVVRIKRRISIPPTPDIAVEYLALGPREEDGLLTTALVDRSLIVPTINVREGRAEVELSDEFNRLTSTQQYQLCNQLIATLTALPGVGVGAVQFFRLGVAIPVLRPDGQLAGGPQTRDDIAEFIVDDPAAATDTTLARPT
jgi:hypothetical protein